MPKPEIPKSQENISREAKLQEAREKRDKFRAELETIMVDQKILDRLERTHLLGKPEDSNYWQKVAFLQKSTGWQKLRDIVESGQEIVYISGREEKALVGLRDKEGNFSVLNINFLTLKNLKQKEKEEEKPLLSFDERLRVITNKIKALLGASAPPNLDYLVEDYIAKFRLYGERKDEKSFAEYSEAAEVFRQIVMNAFIAKIKMTGKFPSLKKLLEIQDLDHGDFFGMGSIANSIYFKSLSISSISEEEQKRFGNELEKENFLPPSFDPKGYLLKE